MASGDDRAEFKRESTLLNSKWGQALADHSGKGKTKSAMTPIVILASTIAASGFFAIVFLKNSPWLQFFILCLVAIPVLAASGGFLYFAAKNPAMLQSEDYLVIKQSLQLVQEKGSKFTVESVSLPRIANPKMPEEEKSLPPKEEKKTLKSPKLSPQTDPQVSSPQSIEGGSEKKKKGAK